MRPCRAKGKRKKKKKKPDSMAVGKTRRWALGAGQVDMGKGSFAVPCYVLAYWTEGTSGATRTSKKRQRYMQDT